ncbi:hypothetical protein C4569_02295 [Candidatus Parcubacteria bacterium]|nr:MAG: hypothetical protein C4569_02295 [Candidatus Parcubacteria bacterium]
MEPKLSLLKIIFTITAKFILFLIASMILIYFAVICLVIEFLDNIFEYDSGISFTNGDWIPTENCLIRELVLNTIFIGVILLILCLAVNEIYIYCAILCNICR